MENGTIETYEFKHIHQDQECHLESWINDTLSLGDRPEGEKMKKLNERKDHPFSASSQILGSVFLMLKGALRITSRAC